ncbi:Zinc finger protein [Globisporangium polare]
MHAAKNSSEALQSASSSIRSASPNGSSSGASSSRERSFPCPKPGCERNFHRKFTLREHMKTHTGEKPYQCAIKACAKRFSTSGNLSRHNRLHSRKIHKCTVADCERVFTKAEKLARHLRVHMGSAAYACTNPECNKTFSTSGNLTRHVRAQHHPHHAETTSAPAYPRAAASDSLSISPPPMMAMVKHAASQSVESSGHGSLVSLHKATSLSAAASPRSQQAWLPIAPPPVTHHPNGESISDGDIMDLLQCLFVETPGGTQPTRTYLAPHHQHHSKQSQSQSQQHQRYDPRLMQEFMMSF